MVDRFPKVKVAVVQAAPVLFNLSLGLIPRSLLRMVMYNASG